MRFWLAATAIGFTLSVSLPTAVAADNEPSTADQFYSRGYARQKKDPQGALADFNRAIDLELFHANTLWARASLYADLKRFEEAVADYTTYLEVQPGDYSALFNRGLYRGYLKQYELSVADYEDILDGDVDLSRFGGTKDQALAHAHHYRGKVYLYDLKQPRKAISDFDACLRLDPTTEMVRYRRGTAWHEVGEYASAEADYQEALKADPTYPNLLDARAWQMATCPDPAFRNGTLAVELSMKANDGHHWKIPEHVATLAAALGERGDFDLAVEAQKKALALLTKPDDRRRKMFEERLALYERREPFREPRPDK